jgi:hypothetical protein
MNPKTDEELTAKAASKNLTVDQLTLIIELAEDLERHSDGTIQPMLLQRTAWGCELVLCSINAMYRLELIRMGSTAGIDQKAVKSSCRDWQRHPDGLVDPGPCLIRCVMEDFGSPGSSVIHESDDCVESWEGLRKKILWNEGWIVLHTGEVRRAERLDTCQKSKSKMMKTSSV